MPARRVPITPCDDGAEKVETEEPQEQGELAEQEEEPKDRSWNSFLTSRVGNASIATRVLRGLWEGESSGLFAWPSNKKELRAAITQLKFRNFGDCPSVWTQLGFLTCRRHKSQTLYTWDLQRIQTSLEIEPEPELEISGLEPEEERVGFSSPCALAVVRSYEPVQEPESDAQQRQPSVADADGCGLIEFGAPSLGQPAMDDSQKACRVQGGKHNAAKQKEVAQQLARNDKVPCAEALTLSSR